VTCQLDHLCDLPTDAERRNALNTLPPDLATTYDRVLERISQRPLSRSLVHHVLMWLMTPSEQDARGLKVNALCQALAVQPGNTSIDPEGVPDIHEVLLRCGSLVRLSHDEKYLEFAHFTVEEYLRDANRSSMRSELFPYTADEAVAYRTKTCLTFLLMKHFNEPFQGLKNMRDRAEKFPFYRHASAHWTGAIDDLAEEEWGLVCSLFSPENRGNFASWAYLLVLGNGLGTAEDPESVSTYKVLQLYKGTLDGAIQIACCLRSTRLVSWLLCDRKCDVNTDKALESPLHCALIGLDILKLRLRQQTQPDWTGVDLANDTTKDPGRKCAKVVKLLLAAGAHLASDLAVSVGDFTFPTTISLACASGQALTMIRAGYLPDPPSVAYLLYKHKRGEGAELRIDEIAQELRAMDPVRLDTPLLVKLANCGQNSSVNQHLALASPMARALYQACKTDDVDTLEYIRQSHKVTMLQLNVAYPMDPGFEEGDGEKISIDDSDSDSDSDGDGDSDITSSSDNLPHQGPTVLRVAVKCKQSYQAEDIKRWAVFKSLALRQTMGHVNG
jgi:hypothetical protein